jgi:hypothetical protein
MASRKARDDESNVQDQPPTKRQRIEENGAADAPSASLYSVNDDCLLLILSYLPTDDLNTAAMCNQRLREARNHECLDQTRTATIVCTQGLTISSLFTQIANNGWNERLESNNYNHLNITGLGTLGHSQNV